MSKYIYQKFLLKCDYDNCSIADYTITNRNISWVPEYGEEFCLLDFGAEKRVRKISVNQLDASIDTEEDWNVFVKGLNDVDVLVVTGCFDKYKNPIIDAYREATKRSYLYRLSQADVYIEIA